MTHTSIASVSHATSWFVHRARCLRVITLVAALAASSGNCLAMRIYWTDVANNEVRRASLDGSNVQDVVTSGLVSPTTLAIDNTANQIYVSDEGTNEITRYEADGSNVQTILTQTNELSAIDVDPAGGHVYFANRAFNASSSDRRIERVDTSGSNLVDLITSGLGNPRFMTLDVAGGKMYWTDESIGVRRADLSGSTVQTIVAQPTGSIRGIALDLAAGKVYWANSGNAPVGDGMIQRANLDGSGVETVLTGIDPAGVDLFKGRIYWADPVADKIQSATLDGADVVDLVTTGLSFPSGITIAEIPEPGAVLIALGSLLGALYFRHR